MAVAGTLFHKRGNGRLIELLAEQYRMDSRLFLFDAAGVGARNST
jgi:hypothetical protein